MNFIFPLKSVAVAALCLTASPLVLALSLGRPQGLPLIGRPLELSVPVTLDAPLSADAPCLSADVFYGDTRVESSRIAVRFVPAAGNAATARVQVAAAVDEPYVIVYLKLGCNQAATRRYVLFSEQPPEVGEASAVTSAQAAPVRMPTMGAPAGLGGTAAAGSTAETTTARPAATRERVRRSASDRVPILGPQAAKRPSAKVQVAATEQTADRPATSTAASAAPRARSAQSRAAPRTPQVQGARLRLEPLELEVMTPRLQLSPLLQAPSPATAQQRSEAGALWKAINTPPEEILRTAQRMQAAESQVQTLRDGQRRQDAGAADLRTRLQSAEEGRYANPLVYALAFLLLAAVAGLVWLLRRPQAQDHGVDRAWWRADDAAPDSRVPEASWRKPAAPAALPELPVATPAPSGPSGELGALGGQSAAMPLLPSGERASVRTLNAEELSDVQQQADFFVSLGDHDRAIEILKAHVQAHPRASAVAWLDMLDIFHRLQRAQDYEAVRSDFQRLFNAQIPAYDSYQEQAQGLEDYPAALSRIQSLWMTPRVLEVIEDSVFRHPDAARAEGDGTFGLEAYRELLLLYNIAVDLLAGVAPSSAAPTQRPREKPSDFMRFDDSRVPVRDFERTRTRSLSAQRTNADMDTTVMVPPASRRLGLDINLVDVEEDSRHGALRALTTEGPEALMQQDPGSPSSLFLEFDLNLEQGHALSTKRAPE